MAAKLQDAGVAGDGLMEGAEGDFEQHALVVATVAVRGTSAIHRPNSPEHLALPSRGSCASDLDLDHAGDGKSSCRRDRRRGR